MAMLIRKRLLASRFEMNTIYWALGLEPSRSQKADAQYAARDWEASTFGGGAFRQGLKPDDFAIKKSGLGRF